MSVGGTSRVKDLVPVFAVADLRSGRSSQWPDFPAAGPVALRNVSGDTRAAQRGRTHEQPAFRAAASAAATASVASGILFGVSRTEDSRGADRSTLSGTHRRRITPAVYRT